MASGRFTPVNVPKKDTKDWLEQSKERRGEYFSEFCDRLFSPLQFPPELATRILTHGSHRLAKEGHNAALAFIGRRVLAAYLQIFLQSRSNLTPMHDVGIISSQSLHSNLLGEHVGHEWGIGQVMVWQPATPAETFERKGVEEVLLRKSGLYAVQGETVQAFIGGIYRQFGATVAYRAFHTRLLPHVCVKGGLPLEFHDDVTLICSQLGGPEGSLLDE